MPVAAAVKSSHSMLLASRPARLLPAPWTTAPPGAADHEVQVALAPVHGIAAQRGPPRVAHPGDDDAHRAARVTRERDRRILALAGTGR